MVLRLYIDIFRSRIIACVYGFTFIYRYFQKLHYSMCLWFYIYISIFSEVALKHVFMILHLYIDIFRSCITACVYGVTVRKTVGCGGGFTGYR